MRDGYPRPVHVEGNCPPARFCPKRWHFMREVSAHEFQLKSAGAIFAEYCLCAEFQAPRDLRWS